MDNRHGRILILAPQGRNAQVAAELLAQADFAITVCDTPPGAAAEVERGAAALLLTAEALSMLDLAPLETALHNQPPWSQLPLLVVVPAEADLSHSPFLEAVADDVVMLPVPQPAAAHQLVRAAGQALQSRQRQQQVATLLEQLDRLNQRLETNLQEQVEEVRSLASRLSRAEQRERERIAGILHDHLQQILYSIQIQLQIGSRPLPAAEPDAGDFLEQINQLLEEAIDATRTLTADLTPPALNEEGLAPALRWLADNMESRHHLKVTLSIESEDKLLQLEEDKRFLLFQMARELLFNVVKHAHVAEAALALREPGGNVILQVRDEGQGFEADMLNRQDREGYGLRSIEERVALFGGTVQVESSPGEGTTVTLELPA